MPPRRSRRSKKFVLGLKELRLALAKSESIAAQAVTEGQKAVERAKKAGDHAALQANLVTLAGATLSQASLAASIRLITGACCEQSFGCDPDYV